jgi:FkbM family methyltransferase
VKGGEYELPAAFEPDDVIVDIGAHIGAFSDTVLERGAGLCYSYEADVDLCDLARQNLAAYGTRAVLHNKAVWGSAMQVNFVKSPLTGNTGGGHMGEEGIPMDPIPFDTIMTGIFEGLRRPIRMLKLDCEGGEWSIVLESRLIRLPHEILGEYHENRVPRHLQEGRETPITRENLRRALEAAGFTVRLQPNPHWPHLGLFYARRLSPVMP